MKFIVKSEITTDNSIKICLTNLGKYNEGKLVYEWVKLPVQSFEPFFKKIGLNEQYEEYFISDYEAPFKINEYDNLNELNEIAKKCQNFSEIDWVAFSEYLDNGYNKEEAFKKVEDQEYFFIEGITDREVGINFIEETGGLASLPREELERYFDYESFGSDLLINGSYNKVRHGNIYGYISIE